VQQVVIQQNICRPLVRNGVMQILPETMWLISPLMERFGQTA